MIDEDGRKAHLLQGYDAKNVEKAIIFVYTHGNDPLDVICCEWSIARVYAVAFMMQDQMFPDSKQVAREKEGFQSGTTEERRGNISVKTTKMSWPDMAKAARAGIDTSIKAV